MRVDSVARERYTERTVAVAVGASASSVELLPSCLRNIEPSITHRLGACARRARDVLGAGLVLSALGMASSAAAGPNESPRQFAYNPMVPDLWILKYQYSRGGLLVSTDAGASWGMMCGDSYDGMPRPKETYGMAIASDASVFLGDFGGLLVGHDQACSWSFEPALDGLWVSDLQTDPLDPTRIFAVTSSGGTGNGIWAYDGTSQVWSQLGPQEELTISSLFAVPRPEGGLRFYESVTRNDPMTFAPSFFVRYSDDDGATWTEHEYPDLAADWLLVVAADASNPDRVVVVEKHGPDDDPDRVLLSEQAASTGSFQVVTDDSHFGGAVFDATGLLYVGRTTGGLTVVRTPGGQPEYMELFVAGEDNSVVKPSPRTLTFHPDKGLLAGVLEDFGTINVETGEFVSMLNFRQVERFHTCEGRDLAMECSEQLNFDAWCVHPGYDVAPFCLEAYPKPGAPGSPSMSPTSGAADPTSPAPVVGTEDPEPVGTTGDGGSTTPAQQPMGGAAQPEMAAAPASDSGSCKVGTGMGTGSSSSVGWLVALGAALFLRRRWR